MNPLLDVNGLIALIWPTHAQHATARSWLVGKKVTLCPITELGFVRVATALNSTMSEARQALKDFIEDEAPDFIAADSRALDGKPSPNSKTTTDFYLANLADAHGLKLATFDTGIKHPAVEQII